MVTKINLFFGLRNFSGRIFYIETKFVDYQQYHIFPRKNVKILHFFLGKMCIFATD